MFAFVAFQGKFNPELYSDRYKKNFNLNDMTFTCINSGEKISIEDFDNGICDCCDGSDEVFNSTFSCKNTCAVHFPPNDVNVLKEFYSRGIVNRIALGQEGQIKYNDLKKQTNEINDNMLQLEEVLTNLTNKVHDLDNEVHKWVYDMNGMKMPTEDEKEAEKMNYINKEKNIKYQCAEDEEEGEDVFEEKIDIKAFEMKKQRREEKWIYLQQQKYNELYNKAIKKYQESQENTNISPNDFLSKLFANRETTKKPQVVQDYINTEKLLNKTKEEKEKLSNKIFNNNYRLGFDYGKDKQWFDSYAYTFDGKISGTPNRLVITLMNRAYVKLPSKGCLKAVNFGVYDRVTDNLIIYKDDVHNAFIGNTTLVAKVMCFSEKRMFKAYENKQNTIEAILGAPEVCPTQFEQSEFSKWLQEIHYYAEDILNERIYDNL